MTVEEIREREREQCCEDMCWKCEGFLVDRQKDGKWYHYGENVTGRLDCEATPIRERHWRENTVEEK